MINIYVKKNIVVVRCIIQDINQEEEEKDKNGLTPIDVILGETKYENPVEEIDIDELGFAYKIFKGYSNCMNF